MIDAIWWDYRLSDFIMFSGRVYDRQLQLHNETWPGIQLVSLGLGGLLFWLALSPSQRSRRLILAILAFTWVWVAWSFLWQRYAQINLVAEYAALAFALQAVGLLTAAYLPKGPVSSMPTGALLGPAIVILVVPLFAYPLFAPILGKPLLSGELFAMMPDPTAIATLSLLAVSTGSLRWPLMIVPTVWILVSAATLWVLGSGMFWVVSGLTLAAVLLAIGSCWSNAQTAIDR